MSKFCSTLNFLLSLLSGVLDCGRYSSCSFVSAHGLMVIVSAWRSGLPGSIPGPGKNEQILQYFEFSSKSIQ